MLSSSDDSVIILGAGASVESGVPAQDCFLSVAKELCAKSSHRYARWYTELVTAFQEKHLSTENIEKLWCAVEMLRDFPFIDLSSVSNQQDGILATMNTRPARYLIEAIRFLIVHTLREKLLSPEPTGFSAYQDLVRHFSGTIISFNWDNLVELAYLNAMGSQLLIESEQQQRLKLIKLHGSIDWLHNLNENTIEMGVPLSKKTMWDDASNEETSSRLAPVLIYPAYSKSIQLNQLGDLMLNLWSSAYDSLTKASRILFVGYSLPDSDIDANILLQHSLSRSLQNRIKVEVIDKNPNQNLMNRYKSIFATSKKDIAPTFRQMTFVEWIGQTFQK